MKGACINGDVLINFSSEGFDMLLQAFKSELKH